MVMVAKASGMYDAVSFYALPSVLVLPSFPRGGTVDGNFFRGQVFWDLARG